MKKRLVALCFFLSTGVGAQDMPQIELSLGFHRIEAEVAARDPERQTGLMHRQSLPAQRGMLFVFPQDNTYCMWMRNTLIPLSVAFLDGEGRIINIASLQSVRAFPNSAPYGASKGGVVQLTRAMAEAWSKDGITCNAICPGYVLTPLVEAQIPDQMKVHNMDRETVIREVMLERQPSRQFATVEEIGGTCSPKTSRTAPSSVMSPSGVEAPWALR